MDSTSDLQKEIERLRQENDRLTSSAASQEQALQRLKADLNSQRIESVGRLAGGIAHHINNALTAILGYAGLAQMDAPAGSDLSISLENIRTAAQRASEFTHQLLMFARRTPRQVQRLNLNTLLAEIQTNRAHLLSENISLQIKSSADLHEVYADPEQLQHALLHLLANARDAMPEGGSLILSTANRQMEPEDALRIGGAQPGTHVVLTVSDTGAGMSEEVKARLFEPFYTTKPQGQGNGLGLAAVLSIMQESGGAITVESEPGKGTTFRLYFPAAETEAKQPAACNAALTDREQEIILLVEEDALLRGLTSKVLRTSGYRVLEAADAAEALLLAESHNTPVALLITEIRLLQMSGRELARQLQQTHPQIKTLFTAGFMEDNTGQRGAASSWVSMLQKPFTVEQLLQRVRHTLKSTPSD